MIWWQLWVWKIAKRNEQHNPSTKNTNWEREIQHTLITLSECVQSLLLPLLSSSMSPSPPLSRPLLSLALAACSLLLLLSLQPLPQVAAVDRGKFRTCQHTDFCKRHRATQENKQRMNYHVEVRWVITRRQQQWEKQSSESVDFRQLSSLCLFAFCSLLTLYLSFFVPSPPCLLLSFFILSSVWPSL